MKGNKQNSFYLFFIYFFILCNLAQINQNVNKHEFKIKFDSSYLGNIRSKVSYLFDYLTLLASLSDSRRMRISFSLTGPTTFLTNFLSLSSKKQTWTCVIPPLEPKGFCYSESCLPVLPTTFSTIAYLA